MGNVLEWVKSSNGKLSLSVIATFLGCVSIAVIYYKLYLQYEAYDRRQEAFEFYTHLYGNETFDDERERKKRKYKIESSVNRTLRDLTLNYPNRRTFRNAMQAERDKPVIFQEIPLWSADVRAHNKDRKNSTKSRTHKH